MAKTTKKSEETAVETTPAADAAGTTAAADVAAKTAQADPVQDGIEKQKASAAAKGASRSKKTRTETDLLGDMEVPADAYYGVHTLRAMDNFQISYVTINTIPDFIRGMVMVKKATAMANRRLHVLPKKKAEAIIWACDQILDEGRCMDQFPLCLLYTSDAADE